MQIRNIRFNTLIQEIICHIGYIDKYIYRRYPQLTADLIYYVGTTYTFRFILDIITSYHYEFQRIGLNFFFISIMWTAVVAIGPR